MTRVTPAALAQVPGPAPDLDPYTVTPGIGGFLVFFALALAAWFLYRSFVRHMRRVQVRALLEAEERDRERGGRPGEDADGEGRDGEKPRGVRPGGVGPGDVAPDDDVVPGATDARRDRP